MSSRIPKTLASLCALAMGLAPGVPVIGKPAHAPDTYTPCQASGWAAKPDTRIHAGPWDEAPVAGTISPRNASGSEFEIAGLFPEFGIHGAWNGWFLISGTSYGDYDDPPPDEAPYAGYGWIRGEDISGQVLPGGFRDAPSEEAPSRDYGTDTDAIVVKRVLACNGWWLRVETDAGTGWVAGLCGNQVTTCG